MRSVFFKGLTLIEVLVSMLLMTVVFLAVAALFVASQRFYFSESDKVSIGYELGYAIEHIHKNVMQGIGDKNSPSVVISPGKNNLEFTVRQIDRPDPADSPSYSDYTDDYEVTYTITNDGRLSYQKIKLPSGTIVEQDTDMVPGVTILSSNDPVTGEQYSRFYLNGEVLRVKFTAEFPIARAGAAKERLTLYSAYHPRLSSFQ